MSSGLRFQKRFSWNVVGSQSWRSVLCSFTEIIFSISAAFFVSDSVLHICWNYFFCHNVFILLPLAGTTNLRLLVGICAARMLAYVQISRWNGVQSWRLSPFFLRIDFRYANTFPPASFQRSHRVVLAHFCIICSRHLIAVWSSSFCQPFGYLSGSCNCHHFLPFLSPGDVRVVHILP